jgi:hypothetical protein
VEKPDFAGLVVDLASSGVDFVICGGIACVLHGVNRTTMDLDIRVPDSDDNFRRLVSVLRKRNMSSRIPEPIDAICDRSNRTRWVEEKGALVWTAQSADGFEQVDIFLSYPISWERLKSNAATMQIRGCPVSVSSREDLIEAKRAVVPPRKKDLRDIEDLEDLQ